MDRQGVGAIACDRVEDGIGSLCPNEGLWVGIVDLNERGDDGFEIVDAAMDAALDLLVAEESEPAFYLIEPGGPGRGEVEVIARVAGEPRFHGWGLMGGVIVEQQMDVEIGRHGLLDLGQELAEFDLWLRTLVRRVQADCAIEVDGNSYSVPWRLIGESVQVVVSGGQVRISHTGREVAVHAQTTGRRQRIADPTHFHGVVGVARPVSVIVPAVTAPAQPALLRPLAEYEQLAGGGWS